ncbi:hypothetical protein [Plantibacter sp. YIM 135249]|uniref:hypothetical protein n=1 Tax=Plantibacter sp. YIM 135249 TaxID=3423918 RepID=UPI003D338B46
MTPSLRSTHHIRALRLPSPPGRTSLHLLAHRLKLLASALLCVLVLTLVGADAAASAATATGEAHGHRSAANGRWLGSWALDDGHVGFCVNLERPVPPGHHYELVDETALGWYSPDDAARLAYLSRRWGGSTDADTAAAGQLSTWTITGLAGHDPAEIASRAGGSAARVLALSAEMLAAANGTGGATRSVTASLSLDRGDDDFDVLRAELSADMLSGGPTTLPAGAHTGTATLVGARFETGETTREITNGQQYRIVPDSDAALVSVSAQASFGSLPYGRRLTVAHNPGNVQSLLLAEPSDAEAAATIDATRPTPLPFQPHVVTQTSATTAETGAPITDELTVDVAPGPDLSSEWGLVTRDDGTHVPVPVTVRSQLLGPFDDAPAEAPDTPEGAPVVCDVTTVVDQGPGAYRTAACVLPGPGHYVWVERIEPSDTPRELGGDRVRPWRSAFGVATEVTMVPRPPAPPASTPPAAAGARLPETGVDAELQTTLLACAGAAMLLGAGLVARPLTRRRAGGSAVRGPGRSTALRGSR